MAALRGCDSPFAIAAHASALRQCGIDFVMRRYSRDRANNLDASEALSWLALTPPDTVAARHALLQWPAARLVLDGVELRLAPVLGQPGRDPGLFRIASGAHGDARRARFHAANHGRI